MDWKLSLKTIYEACRRKLHPLSVTVAMPPEEIWPSFILVYYSSSS